MESSSGNSHDVSEVLEHSNKQVKRLKKLVKCVDSYSAQAMTQAEKVNEISGKAVAFLSGQLSGILDPSDVQEAGTSNPQSSDIQSKLRKILAIKKTSRNFEKETLGQSSKAEFPADSKLPSLPVCPEYTSSDDAISETDSEYFPDSDSNDSLYSERSVDNIRLGESCKQQTGSWSGRFEDALYEEESLQFSDDEFDDLFDEDEIELSDLQMQRRLSGGNDLGGGSGMVGEGHAIMPAAGNDDPGTSGSRPTKKIFPRPPPNALNLNDDVMTSSDKTCIKPQAVRRVKSMVLQNDDLEDGMAIGKRMFVLQQKRNNDVVMTSTPSPLLSSQDVCSLKKSPSQTNARFTLKRSRSNLSLKMTPFKRGQVALVNPNDVIPEEKE